MNDGLSDPLTSTASGMAAFSAADSSFRSHHTRTYRQNCLLSLQSSILSLDRFFPGRSSIGESSGFPVKECSRFRCDYFWNDIQRGRSNWLPSNQDPGFCSITAHDATHSQNAFTACLSVSSPGRSSHHEQRRVITFQSGSSLLKFRVVPNLCMIVWCRSGVHANL